MKRLFVLLLSAFIIFVPAVAGADDAPVVRVGHVGHDHQLALYVALDAAKSLDKDYGVYVEELKPMEVYDLYDKGKKVARIHLVLVTGGSGMPAALDQGHIEVGLGGLGPVAKFVDKGARVKVLAPLNNDGDALMLRRDFPANDWDEFVKYAKTSPKPVRIGYKDPMAVAYMIFDRGLKEEGISHGVEPTDKDGHPVQVIMVNLQDLASTLPAMENNVVDGAVVNEPMGAILEHKGAGKRAADLSKLPPKGKWENHPCCVVAATEDAISGKRPQVKALLKLIAAGADLMKKDINAAYQAEARWTRVNPEVGKMSIANVTYVGRPDKQWLKGVDTWLDLMTSSGYFNKNLKDKSSGEIRKLLLDMSPMEEAVSDFMKK